MPVQRCARRHRPVGAERQRRAGLVQGLHLVLAVGAFDAEPRDGQHRHQRVHLRPQRLHVGDDAELGEPADVGLVDQLDVRDHRSAVATFRCAAARIRWRRAPGGRRRHRWRGCGSAARARRRGGPPRPASRPPSCACPWLCRPEQYGASSAPVSFSTTPSAKNFTVCAVSSGEPTSSTRASRLGVIGYLRIEMARVGVEGEVEPHPQRVAPGGLDVGGDVAGFDPGVLHPRHAAGQVVVGGGAQRADALALVAAPASPPSPDRLHPTRVTCRAPIRRRGAGSRRAPGRECRR